MRMGRVLYTNFVAKIVARTVAKIKIAKDFKGYEINEIDEVIIPQDSDIEVHSPRLRQTDLTSKLTAAVSAPMWMRE